MFLILIIILSLLSEPIYNHSFPTVIVEKANKYKCSLNSEVNNFHHKFSDINEIVNISAKHKKIEKPFLCRWKFTSPTDHGFKVVITKLNTSPTTDFFIQNTTDIITNKRNLVLFHAYYNSDNSIEITLSKNNCISMHKLNFKAYITIVYKNFKHVANKNCAINEYLHVQLWSYKNYGYNMRCIFDLVIPPGSEMIVVPTTFDIENGVDNIRYYIDKYNNSKILGSEDIFVLAPYTNGTDRQVLFEFTSDGSVQGEGFEVSFYEIICQCVKSIPCDDLQNHYLMPETPNYCGNLHCIITFKPCTDGLTFLSISFDSDEHLNDIFKFFSNGIVVLEINAQNRLDMMYFVYLNSSYENYLEVITYQTESVKQMFIISTSYIVPHVKMHVTLSSETTYSIIDTGLSQLTAAEIVDFEKSPKFTIYTNLLVRISIYNNESLTFPLTSYKCFDSNFSPNKCEISRQKIAIFARTIDMFPLVIIRGARKTKGCVFEENIYFTNRQDIFYVAGISNNESSCDILLMIDEGYGYIYNYHISHLWTTSKNEDVKVFIGMDKTKLFFKFNSKTADKWKTINLLSKIYIIEIPKNSAVFLTLSQEAVYDLAIDSCKYQTMIATPRYGTAKTNYVPTGDNSFMNLNANNCNVKLTVIDYQLPKDDTFYFIVNNGEKTNVTAGQSIIFQKSHIKFYYISHISNKNETNGVLIFAEIFQNDSNKLIT